MQDAEPVRGSNSSDEIILVGDAVKPGGVPREFRLGL